LTLTTYFLPCENGRAKTTIVHRPNVSGEFSWFILLLLLERAWHVTASSLLVTVRARIIAGLSSDHATTASEGDA
jgi:hypothetical protein